MNHLKSGKLKFYLIFVLCATILISGLVIVFGTAPRSGFAETLEIGGEGYKEKYIVGETIELLPATITDGTEDYQADGTLIFPSGKSIRADSVVLDEVGIYTVEYKATAQKDGNLRNYSANTEFTVVNSMYSVTSDRSSIRYGVDESGNETGLTGLNVSLNAGDSFVVNEPIDLNDVSADQLIAKLNVLPETIGNPEANTVNFILTDCYDAENYVTISFNSGEINFGSEYQSIVYIGAGAYNQNIRGCNGQGTNYGQPPGNGRWAHFSMGGNNEVRTLAEQYIGFSMDYAARSVYVSTITAQNAFTADLTDLSWYEDIWNGFTTGECFLSINCDNYVGKKCNLIITEILDFDLSQEEVLDGIDPEIEINYGAYTAENYPNAVLNCAYPVFGYETKDLSGSVASEIKVFYNYYSKYKYEIPVENGKFIPARLGVYTLEYTAVDPAGNDSQKTIDVYCVNDEFPVEVVLSDDAPVSSVVGKEVPIKTAELANAVGMVETLVYAEYEEERIEIVNGSFTPYRAGTYQVFYIMTDFVGRVGTASYTVNIAENEELEFLGEPQFEKYYIVGKSYALPVLTAIDYISGKTAEAEIYVTDGVEERRVLNNYIPVMSDDGTAQIRYYASLDGKSKISDPYTIRLRDVSDTDGTLNLEKYFEAEDLTVRQNTSYISLIPDGTAGSAEFIRPFFVNLLNLRFSLAAATSSFTVYLTDRDDPDTKISFSAVKTSAGATFWCNGEETIFTYIRGFAESILTPYEIYFDISSLNVYDGNKINYTITETVSGESFTGFPSGYAYISFEINGGQANLYSINGQAFSDISSDSVAPNIYLTGEYRPLAELNEEITVYKAIASDMLDPFTVVTVTMEDSEGNYLETVDGRELHDLIIDADLKTVLTEYGSYYITYTARDSSYRQTQLFAALNVYDLTKPEIRVEAPTISDGTISISAAEPEEGVTIFVYVEDNCGISHKITENSFALNGKGTYYVKYLAVKQSGTMMNFAWKIYKVTI